MRVKESYNGQYMKNYLIGNGNGNRKNGTSKRN
jgi:hypothetical protein